MEACVSPVGVNELMTIFHTSQQRFNADDIVYLHFHL